MKKGKQLLRELGLPIAWYYLGYLGGFYALVLLRNALHLEVSGAELNGLAMMIGLTALMPQLLQERVVREQENTAGRHGRHGRPLDWVCLVVLAVCSATLMNRLITLTQLQNVSHAYTQAQQSLYSVPFAVGLVLYGLAAPFAEEALFRYLLAGRIRRLTGSAAAAALISALMFGVYHANLVQGIYAFTIGILLAAVFFIFEDYRAAVLFHASSNIASYTASEWKALGTVFENETMMMTMAVLTILILAWWIFRWYGQNKIALEKDTTDHTEG